MIYFKTLLLYALACIININSLVAQAITAEDWRSDLKYFQHLVHSKYPNLFFSVSGKQFDSAVGVLDKKIGTLNDVQMKVEFAKLVALFRIGHTAVRRQWNEGNQ